MIYCFYGTDSAKTRKAARALVNATQKKKPDASFFHITSENWSEARFEELLHGAGLFEQKYIVLLDNLFEDKDIKNTICDGVKDMSDADHLFVLLEGVLDKKTLTKIEKSARKVIQYNVSEVVKKKENDFALANAVGRRDRKQAWVLLQSALERGVVPEALHGMLFWKVKSMLLAGNQRAFTKEELHTLSHQLLEIHHRARTGRTTLDIALERFVLGL